MRPSEAQPRPLPLAWAGALALLALAVVVGLGWTIYSLRQKNEQPASPGGDAATVAQADNADKNPQPEEGGEVLLMDVDSRHAMARSVAQVVALRSQGAGAFTQLALARLDPGSAFLLTPEDNGAVPPIRPDLLRFVRDNRKIASFSENEGEALAYCDALVKASRTPAENFARSARRDLSFVNVFEEPGKYRGDVIRVRGRLRLVNRFDPPAMAANLSAQIGAKDLYECWVYDEQYAAAPWCVLLTELPPEVKSLGSVDYAVVLDGYFFKRYRYKAQDSVKPNQFRDAPLLIGKTLTVLNPRTETGADWSFSPVVLLLALLGGTGLVVSALTWWYRSEDRRIRARLAAACTAEFVEPPPDAPVAPPVKPARNPRQPASGESTRHTYGHGPDKIRAVHRALGQGGIDSS